MHTFLYAHCSNTNPAANLNTITYPALCCAMPSHTHTHTESLQGNLLLGKFPEAVTATRPAFMAIIILGIIIIATHIQHLHTLYIHMHLLVAFSGSLSVFQTMKETGHRYENPPFQIIFSKAIFSPVYSVCRDCQAAQDQKVELELR